MRWRCGWRDGGICAAGSPRPALLREAAGRVAVGSEVWCDAQFLQLTDWPAGLLESALISEAQRCGAHTVVAFAPATTDYARLLRRARWLQAGIDAMLVTIADVTGGAMAEVLRRLGQAFTAFWTRENGSYPPGTAIELLR